MKGRNYDPIFTVDNGSCDYSCFGRTDERHAITMLQLKYGFRVCGRILRLRWQLLDGYDGDGVCDVLETGCTMKPPVTTT